MNERVQGCIADTLTRLNPTIHNKQKTGKEKKTSLPAFLFLFVEQLFKILHHSSCLVTLFSHIV